MSHMTVVTCVPFPCLRSVCPAQASLLLWQKGVFSGIFGGNEKADGLKRCPHRVTSAHDRALESAFHQETGECSNMCTSRNRPCSSESSHVCPCERLDLCSDFESVTASFCGTVLLRELLCEYLDMPSSGNRPRSLSVSSQTQQKVNAWICACQTTDHNHSKTPFLIKIVTFGTVVIFPFFFLRAYCFGIYVES